MLRPAWTGRFRTPARKPSIYAPSNANGPQTPFLLGLQAIDCKGYSNRFPFPVSRCPLPAMGAPWPDLGCYPRPSRRQISRVSSAWFIE